MNGEGCLVVMYHYVRDTAETPFPAIRALPPALFEQQLDWLQRERRPISYGELEAAVERGAPLPANAALLTFDDGLVDHYETAVPILKRRGLTGLFFLTHDACGPSPRVLGVHKTHFLLAKLGADAFASAVLDQCEEVLEQANAARRARVFGTDRWEHANERAVKDLLNYELSFEAAERMLTTLFARYVGDDGAFARALYLNSPMVAEMAQAGMTFGYHTRSHRMLSRLPASDQEVELRDGVRWVRELTGQTRVPFCYPWGGPATYNADTLRILDEMGYSVAFNTVRDRIDVGRDGRFELPRIDARDLPPYTGGEPDTMATVAEDA